MWRNRCVDFLACSSEDEGQSGLRSWKKATENRTLLQSTDTHVSSLAQASGRNTVVLYKFEPALLLRKNGHKVWQKKGQREVLLCTNESVLELLCPGESETTATHREEARADYNRTLKQLRPSSSFVPSLVHTRTLVAASHVADFPAQKKTL